MAKIHFGDKGQRLKYNVYFFGITLLIILGACHVCRRIDWSALQRRELEKHLLEVESEILIRHQPPEYQTRELIGRANMWLRDRWLAGYLYSELTKQGVFVGRIWPEFRKAVEAQKDLIDANKPFERKKIPKLRLIVEFKRLKARMLIAEVEVRQDEKEGVPGMR